METDKITSSYLKNLGEHQFNVEANLKTDDASNISKVVMGGANAYIDEIEMLNGEAHYTGAVVFDVLFVDAEGASQILSETIDINGKIQNDQISVLMKPIYSVEVVDCKISEVDGDMAKATATVAIKLNAIKTDEIETVKIDSPDIQLNSETARLHQLGTYGTAKIALNEDFESKQTVKRILITTSHTELKNASAGTGYISVDGELMINSLLEVETDEGLALKNFMQVLPFKEEIENEQVAKDDDVFAFAFARPNDVVVSINTPSEDANKNQTINVSAEVTIKYITEREAETTISTDAFSMTNKTNIVSGTYLAQKPTKIEKFKTTIDGQTTIGDDEARIAKICAVTNEHLLIANSAVSDGELTIEGVAYATAIYLTDDDVPTLEGVDLEVPFSSKFDVSSDFDGELFVTGDVKDVDVKAKKGKEINISFDVCFLAFAHSTTSGVMIKDIELTEPLPASEFALEMYVAPKGSTLWDISKNMLVTEDVLLKQNPDLIFPLESSKTIVHFRQRAK